MSFSQKNIEFFFGEGHKFTTPPFPTMEGNPSSDPSLETFATSQVPSQHSEYAAGTVVCP